MSNQKILVTGAGGFIGSHVTECLVKQGYKVKAFVEYNSFNSWGWLDFVSKDILSEVEIFSGDVRDPFGVKKAMESCSKVLHLAALIGIPYSYHSPESYLETNVKGTLNIVQAARDLGIERVIHTSTSEVYGTAQYVPIDESIHYNPNLPIQPQKLQQIRLPYLIIIHLSYLFLSLGPLILMVPGNQLAPSFQP